MFECMAPCSDVTENCPKGEANPIQKGEESATLLLLYFFV